MMSAYMDTTGGTAKQPKQVTPEDVHIGEYMTHFQASKIRQLNHELREVFMRSPDDIPPALNTVPPVKWELKEGGKPVRCKKPNWGPATTKFLTAYTKKALAAGLIKPATSTRWASRPVLAPKYRGDTPKGAIPDDIRTCVDYTGINDQIHKKVDQYPDPQALMRKAAGHKFYFEADAQKQFNSIKLEEGITQEMTAFWTPLGLMMFTRLIMGAKNSSAIAQAIYRTFMTTHLPEETQASMVNFQDDFLGFDDDGDELIKHYE